jgi:hypothetical protein
VKNVTLCNNCAGSIVLSLKDHYIKDGLKFCCEECADHFFSPENSDKTPVGLQFDWEEES